MSTSDTNLNPGMGVWQFFDDGNDDYDQDLLDRGRDASLVLEHIRRVQEHELTLQAVVTLGEQTTEGQVIEAVCTAWFALVQAFVRNPQLMFDLDSRKWEEMIAGAYAAEGWEIVTLTPRSGDGGKDVIATRRDFGSIRFIEQVKRYSPGNLVTFEEVTAMLGVLDLERNASKGIITTTSDFAPGVYTNNRIAELRPSRLDLRPGLELLKWLSSIKSERTSKGSKGGA